MWIAEWIGIAFSGTFLSCALLYSLYQCGALDPSRFYCSFTGYDTQNVERRDAEAVDPESLTEDATQDRLLLAILETQRLILTENQKTLHRINELAGSG